MKIVALHSAMPTFEQGLNNVSKILKDTFFELGIEIESINLAVNDIKYFDGSKSQTIDNILKQISLSDGVIIESTSVLSMPCAIMQTFFEHLGFGNYQNAFQRKKCFCVTVSNDGSEKKACDYIMDIIADFGGIDVGKIMISENEAKVSLHDLSIKEAIEKYAEDLYRILKQERRFIIPSKKRTSSSSIDENMALRENVTKVLGHEPAPKKINSREILEQIDYSDFNARQEEDIKEISKFLTNQYNSEKNDNYSNFNANNKFITNQYNNDFMFNQNEVVPHIKSCQQRTQSLYHYFQPQLATGVEAIIQINVKGDEKFEGYLSIKNANCEYTDGVHEDPDVTVFSDCNVWLDILNGKYTIQKAFMIGQLKVRGNFVLMTKFDQLFKMQK